MPLKFFCYTFLLSVVLLSGCKKWLLVPPPEGTPTTTALFADETAARGVLSGVYRAMITGSVFSSSLTTLYGGLAADELDYYTPGLLRSLAQNEISPPAHGLLSAGWWQPAYRFIYTANLALEQLPSAPLSPAVKRTLSGEAHFVRAFSYFCLVNFFGGVPLVRATDYRETVALPRSNQQAVYEQVLEDLRRAENELPVYSGYGQRARPDRQAATALRARVHLYRRAWIAAEADATAVIESGLFELTELPGTVFEAGSKETIFYLEAAPPLYLLPEAITAVPHSDAALPTYLVRPQLAAAFEAGDLRKSAWIGQRTYAGQLLPYPAKYKGKESGYVVLRLGELYLVRAEARARLGAYSGAVEDLNTVRRRAGLSPLLVSDRAELLHALEQERRRELAFEWGHRWNDLRRTGQADAVLGALKGTTWQATDTLWPVPEDQLLLNAALTQNPGY